MPTAYHVWDTGTFGCNNTSFSILWLMVFLLQLLIGGFLVFQGWRSMDYLILLRSKLLEDCQKKINACDY